MSIVLLLVQMAITNSNNWQLYIWPMIFGLLLFFLLYHLNRRYRIENRAKLYHKINDKYYELSILMHNKMILALRKIPLENNAEDKKKKEEKIFHFIAHLKEYERKYLGIATDSTGTKINYDSIVSLNFRKKPDFEQLSENYTANEKKQLGFTTEEIKLIDFEFKNSVRK